MWPEVVRRPSAGETLFRETMAAGLSVRDERAALRGT